MLESPAQNNPPIWALQIAQIILPKQIDVKRCSGGVSRSVDGGDDDDEADNPDQMMFLNPSDYKCSEEEPVCPLHNSQPH